MGDFFSPPPGYPEVPAEPDTPLPNFTQIGANLATGLNQGGMLSGIWNGFLQACAAVLTWALAWILKTAVAIAAWFISVLTSAESDAGANYGVLVANTLQNVFGVTVSPASVNTRGPAAQKQQVANQLAQSLLGAMFAGATAQPGGGIAPSDATANAYLSTVVNMALNGWLETWVTDALSLHELQRFGELKDIMARVLGLGRMSRQVFAAPIKILVHDPYLALLQQKYRPKALAEAEYLKLYWAGTIQRNDLSTLLGNEGYSEQYIDFLIQTSTKTLSVSEVDYLVSHGTWSTGQGLQYIAKLNYGSDGANLIYALEVDKRIEKYRRETCTVAEEAFLKGDLGLADFQQIVQQSGIASDEQPWFIQVAQLKYSLKTTHLSLGQIEQGVLDGILTLNDIRNWAIREGMPLTEEQELELEVLFKQNKQTAATEAKAAAAQARAQAGALKAQAAAIKKAAAIAQQADKGVTVAQAETLVKDGLWTFDQLTAYLTAKQYGPDAINSIVSLLHAAIAKTAASTTAAAGVKAAAKLKGLSLAEMEKAVVDGHRSLVDLQTFLTNAGYDAADSQVIVELVQDEIATAQVKAEAKAAAAAKAASKGITLSEIERAVILGLTPASTYTAALQKAGYDSMSVTLLQGILAAEVSKAAATAAKKALAPSGETSPGITLAQMEAEIIAGIRPITDYTQALAKLGYNVVDQQDLTALLQLKVDNAKATAAKKAAAGNALTNRGISLAQAETAVKLGVVPIATYQTMLQDAGFTQDAIDILSAALLSEIAKTSKAKATATTAAGTAATKGLTLADVARAVEGGIQPISAYTAAVTAAGYSAADADTLTSLLQLKLDHAAAVARMHADAVGKATVKGISIADEEKAVTAGEKTMADYDALLTALGYDQVDRTVLEDLLSSKIGTAAPAPASTPAPPGGTSGTGG